MAAAELSNFALWKTRPVCQDFKTNSTQHRTVLMIQSRVLMFASMELRNALRKQSLGVRLPGQIDF